MSEQILKSIFGKPSGIAIDGQVTGKKAQNLWLVTDLTGRTITAVSSDTWRPGVDWVTVQDSRIVGRARRRGDLPVYHV